MRNTRNAPYAATFMGLAALLYAMAAHAGAMDGSKNITCAVLEVVGCTETGQCAEGTSRDFDLPQILVMDAEQKSVRGAYEAGHGDVLSPVKNLEKNGEHLILQGVENGRGWNIAINTRDGRMSASGVGDAVSFLLFGSCTSI